MDVGFNAVYGWEFHHLLNELAQGKMNVSALAEYADKCDTLWPKETMKMYFTTNHDENTWNGTVSQRMGKLGKAMYVLSSMMERSLPLIYTGQEAGLNHQFPVVCSCHQDYGCFACVDVGASVQRSKCQQHHLSIYAQYQVKLQG